MEKESVEPLKSEVERLQRDLSELRGGMVLVKDDGDKRQREYTELQLRYEEEQKTWTSDLETFQNRCDNLLNEMNHLREENKYLGEAISLHQEEIKRLNTNHEEQKQLLWAFQKKAQAGVILIARTEGGSYHCCFFN